MMVQMVVICKHSTTWSRKHLNGKSTSTALAMLERELMPPMMLLPHNESKHQGREFIANGALENGAFCTVFSENFHKF
jgi:hypothetical protein